MCNCGGILVETSYHTNVCVWCGIERFIGYSPTCRVFSGHFARPLPPSYSRRARFRELLRRVFGLESGPKNEDPVWDYLTRHRPFKDSKDIMGCLKQSGLDNKHYSSIHLFTKLFSPYTPHTYSADQLNQFVETLSKSFEHTSVVLLLRIPPFIRIPPLVTPGFWMGFRREAAKKIHNFKTLTKISKFA